MRRVLGYLLLLFAGSLGLSVPATASDLGEFDLHELSRYKPEQQVAGTIRNFGFGLGGVLQLLIGDTGFAAEHHLVDRDPEQQAGEMFGGRAAVV